MENSELQKEITKVFDTLQKAQLDAGGGFISQTRFKEMTLEKILTLLIPNDVVFTIRHNAENKKNE